MSREFKYLTATDIYFSIGSVIISSLLYPVYVCYPVDNFSEKKLLKSGRRYLSFVPLHLLNAVKRRDDLCMCNIDAKQLYKQQ